MSLTAAELITMIEDLKTYTKEEEKFVKTLRKYGAKTTAEKSLQRLLDAEQRDKICDNLIHWIEELGENPAHHTLVATVSRFRTNLEMSSRHYFKNTASPGGMLEVIERSRMRVEAHFIETIMDFLRRL